jgi:hypothetical protein
MRVRIAASTFLLLMLAVPVASGQRPGQRPTQPGGTQWHQVDSKEVSLRVRLPVQWRTKPAAARNGRSCLEAISPKSTIYLHACSFRNGDLTLDDLLDRTLDELGVDLDDDPDEESINGLDALVGETTATFDGRDLGMFIVVAAYGDTRYVISVMTKANLFDANARTMNRIVDSLAPIATGGK